MLASRTRGRLQGSGLKKEGTMAHPNEEMLRRGYEAFAQGDLEAVKEIFPEDIVFHVPGRGLISGEYRGREAVLGFFAKGQELSGGTLRIELHDVAATDEHAIALQINRAERNAKTLAARVVGVYHIRGGKASEAWFLTDSQDENDQFWS
jgi:ketosteroid isomerase-like protein